MQRDRGKRFQTAAEMITTLEVYLYSDGYGPTNEKLGGHIMELFDVRPARPSGIPFRPNTTPAALARKNEPLSLFLRS